MTSAIQVQFFENRPSSSKENIYNDDLDIVKTLGRRNII